MGNRGEVCFNLVNPPIASDTHQHARDSASALREREKTISAATEVFTLQYRFFTPCGAPSTLKWTASTPSKFPLHILGKTNEKKA